MYFKIDDTVYPFVTRLETLPIVLFPNTLTDQNGNETTWIYTPGRFATPIDHRNGLLSNIKILGWYDPTSTKGKGQHIYILNFTIQDAIAQSWKLQPYQAIKITHVLNGAYAGKIITMTR